MVGEKKKIHPALQRHLDALFRPFGLVPSKLNPVAQKQCRRSVDSPVRGFPSAAAGQRAPTRGMVAPIGKAWAIPRNRPSLSAMTATGCHRRLRGGLLAAYLLCEGCLRREHRFAPQLAIVKPQMGLAAVDRHDAFLRWMGPSVDRRRGAITCGSNGIVLSPTVAGRYRPAADQRFG